MLLEQQESQERWEEAVERLRREIIRDYPAWTDHNVHDPGITIMELFVWMTQVQRYHAGQIGTAHWDKFRKLMGISRTLQKPGSTLVTVDAPEGAFLKAETRFYAGHICFETITGQMVEEDLFLAFRTLADGKEQLLKGSWIARGEGISLYPFGKIPEAGNCFEIELARALKHGVPYRLTMECSKNCPVRRCRVDESQYNRQGFYPLAEIRMEYEALDGWRPVQLTSDDTYGLLQDGCICFQLPLPMAESAWKIRLILVRNDYLTAPAIGRISMAMVQVWQQETFENYAEWRGSGLPDQQYELDDHRIIKEALVLEVEQELYPGQMEVWQQVEDFDRSQPEDNHYCLEQGVIRFGDGFHGKMPEGVIRIRKLVKSLGAMANIKAGTITGMSGALNFPSVNEQAVTGGTSECSSQEAVERYAAEAEVLQRAVTREDYEKLLRTIPGLLIEDCKVYCEAPERRELRLAVKPYTEEGRGRLNEAYVKNIYRYLEGKRMLGTRLQVVSPDYYSLEIVCIVESKVQYRDAGTWIEREIKDWVKKKRFGEGIRYGDLKGKIGTLPCVRRVESLWIDAGSRGRRNEEGDLLMPPNGLFWLKRVVCNLVEA